MFNVKFSPKAEKQLNNFNQKTQIRIIKTIEKKVWDTKYTSPEGAVQIVGMHKITPEEMQISREWGLIS